MTAWGLLMKWSGSSWSFLNLASLRTRSSTGSSRAVTRRVSASLSGGVLM